MNRSAIYLSIAAFTLVACGAEPEPDAATASARAAAQKAAQAIAADPSLRMARAVGSGKPGAAVEIRYEFQSKPAIGTPTDLQIAFVPHAGVDAMEISVQGMEGVTLAGPLTASFADVQPSKPYMHTVSVLPDRTGVFYLSVVATTQIGNSNLSRTFSIPFAVGNVPAQQKPAPQKDASGEPVQPAKARETTKSG